MSEILKVVQGEKKLIQIGKLYRHTMLYYTSQIELLFAK